MLPDHIPPLHEIHRAQAALERFRARLPLDLQLPPPRPRTGSSSSGDDGAYYALADPWYILLHANLLTAEMLTWREMANYDGSTYHRAIASARGLVKLVQYMQPETWVHVGKFTQSPFGASADKIRYAGSHQHLASGSITAQRIGQTAVYRSIRCFSDGSGGG